MTADEFDARRASLVTLLTQRVGQQNWGLTSEVCADLLDLENEWRLSQPLSEPQSDSARYQPVVDEMNQRTQPKRNSFDRQHDLLASAKEALKTIETTLSRMNAEFEWMPAFDRLKAAVAECEANR